MNVYMYTCIIETHLSKIIPLYYFYLKTTEIYPTETPLASGLRN